MQNKEKNFVSVLIYVHNAENRIKNFLSTIISTMEENFEHSEIICINDFSSDNSVEIIRKVSASAKSTSISIVNMSYFHGLELSMNAGMDLSIGDFVFEFDNTVLDFDSSVIMEVYYRSLSGFDIVSASADRPERFTSMMFYKLFNKYKRTAYKMTTESFRILSRRIINRIESMNKTVPYRKAVYANCGLKTDNIIYKAKESENLTFEKREKKYRSSIAIDSLILFTNVGYSFSSTMTIFMMLASIATLIYTLVVYFSSNPVRGWTTTIFFISVAFFGLFGILTIVIKYLQLIIDLVFKRQHYSFESIEKLTK